MPPHSRSRYLASIGRKDVGGNVFLTEREPFRYDPKLAGTRTHVVSGGDKLWQLAHRYWQPFPNAEHLWWVIAEFQPQPIMDLTLDLAEGRVLYIPSLRVLQERVIGF
jgi:hypothetical protein